MTQKENTTNNSSKPYTAKLGRLRIDGGAEMPAEPVLIAADGALFRLK